MKTIVITGATRGLGLAIAWRAVEEGYKVIAIGRKPNDEFNHLLSEYPDQIIFEAYDFTNTLEIHAFSTRIVKEHGRPWGLINNAALGHDGVLATLHERDIAEMIKVNIEAPVLLTKYMTRPMLINRGGRIINVSSIIASTGFNGLSVYAATKAALSGFTRSLAREIGKAGITVNTVAPGYMETDMTSSLKGDKLDSIRRRSPLGHLVSAVDVANAVIFLLSDQSSSITGSTMTIDAGSTA